MFGIESGHAPLGLRALDGLVTQAVGLGYRIASRWAARESNHVPLGRRNTESQSHRTGWHGLRLAWTSVNVASFSNRFTPFEDSGRATRRWNSSKPLSWKLAVVESHFGWPRSRPLWECCATQRVPRHSFGTLGAALSSVVRHLRKKVALRRLESGVKPNGTYFRNVTRRVSKGVRRFMGSHTPLLTRRVSKVSAIGVKPPHSQRAGDFHRYLCRRFTV